MQYASLYLGRPLKGLIVHRLCVIYLLPPYLRSLPCSLINKCFGFFSVNTFVCCGVCRDGTLVAINQLFHKVMKAQI